MPSDLPSENDLESRLSNAIGLRENGSLEESCAALRDLAREYPDHAEVVFQAAWSHDKAGRESEAVGYYERALRGPGLTPGQREEALLGLGSSYRLTGRAGESVRVLDQAVAEFPRNAALRVFQAIAYHADGRHDHATGILLGLLAETSSDPAIIDYRRPIREYAREYQGSPGGG